MASVPLTPKGISTRNSIFRAGLAKINEMGYANVTIQDITTAAGVSKGLFYTYFDSKDDLLRYTFEYIDTAYNESFQVSAYKKNFADRFCLFMKLAYEQVMELGKNVVRAVIYYILFVDDDENGYVLDKRRDFINCSQRLYDIGIQQGHLPESLSFDTFMGRAWAVMIGTECYWCTRGNTVSLPLLMEENMRTLLQGFKPQGMEK